MVASLDWIMSGVAWLAQLCREALPIAAIIIGIVLIVTMVRVFRRDTKNTFEWGDAVIVAVGGFLLIAPYFDSLAIKVSGLEATATAAKKKAEEARAMVEEIKGSALDLRTQIASVQAAVDIAVASVPEYGTISEGLLNIGQEVADVKAELAGVSKYTVNLEDFTDVKFEVNDLKNTVTNLQNLYFGMQVGEILSIGAVEEICKRPEVQAKFPNDCEEVFNKILEIYSDRGRWPRQE